MRTDRCSLALASVMLALAFAPAAAQEVSKIGVLAPHTGGAAADGEEMVRGVTMAIEEANAAGGVAGYTFEVEVGDTRDQSADAVISAFERLSGDDAVNLMITGYASGSNFEIEYMADLGIPYMIAANSQQTRDIIAPSPDDFPTVWSLTPSYDAYETELVTVVEGDETDGRVAGSDRTGARVWSGAP
jgi:branched-chain amino acid transport system substrate-binding protein